MRVHVGWAIAPTVLAILLVFRAAERPQVAADAVHLKRNWERTLASIPEGTDWSTRFRRASAMVKIREADLLAASNAEETWAPPGSRPGDDRLLAALNAAVESARTDEDRHLAQNLRLRVLVDPEVLRAESLARGKE